MIAVADSWKQLKNAEGNVYPITIKKGTWTPHLYDYETFKYSMGTQEYLKIDKLYICFWYFRMPASTTISTMLQVRNLPFSSGWVWGGQMYMANVAGQFGDKTIQASDVAVYLRPNYTGTINGAGSIFSGIIIGYEG